MTHAHKYEFHFRGDGSWVGSRLWIQIANLAVSRPVPGPIGRRTRGLESSRIENSAFASLLRCVYDTVLGFRLRVRATEQDDEEIKGSLKLLKADLEGLPAPGSRLTTYNLLVSAGL